MTNPWVTNIPLKGPIEPGHQPYTAARPEDGKYVLLKEMEVHLTEDLMLPIGHPYLHGHSQEFVSDGVSIPRLLWSTVGMQMGARCRMAGFVHDFLYRHCGKVMVWDYPMGEFRTHTFTRGECDGFFHDHLLRAGIWKPRAWLAYRAVRMYFGGGAAWRAHKRRIAKEKKDA